MKPIAFTCKQCGRTEEYERKRGRARTVCHACIKANTKATAVANRETYYARANERRKLPAGRYASVKGNATQRGFEFSITREEYVTLVTEAGCYYCGGDLPARGGGLDRLDNAMGYTLDNVVPCCFRCNVDRGTLTADEFKLVIRDRVDRGVLCSG